MIANKMFFQNYIGFIGFENALFDIFLPKVEKMPEKWNFEVTKIYNSVYKMCNSRCRHEIFFEKLYLS